MSERAPAAAGGRLLKYATPGGASFQASITHALDKETGAWVPITQLPLLQEEHTWKGTLSLLDEPNLYPLGRDIILPAKGLMAQIARGVEPEPGPPPPPQQRRTRRKAPAGHMFDVLPDDVLWHIGSLLAQDVLEDRTPVAVPAQRGCKPPSSKAAGSTAAGSPSGPSPRKAAARIVEIPPTLVPVTPPVARRRVARTAASLTRVGKRAFLVMAHAVWEQLDPGCHAVAPLVQQLAQPAARAQACEQLVLLASPLRCALRKDARKPLLLREYLQAHMLQPDQEVNKVHAKKTYMLYDADLQGLPYKRRTNPVDPHFASEFVYSMLDITEKAMRKHHLESLEALYAWVIDRERAADTRTNKRSQKEADKGSYDQFCPYLRRRAYRAL